MSQRSAVAGRRPARQEGVVRRVSPEETWALTSSTSASPVGSLSPDDLTHRTDRARFRLPGDVGHSRAHDRFDLAEGDRLVIASATTESLFCGTSSS